jgi:hypothetical protein
MAKYGSNSKVNTIGWNLQTENIDKLAYDIIHNSLNEFKEEYVEINKLIHKINSKSNNLALKYKNENKTLLNYFKIEKKGLIRFIDNYDKFGILKRDNHIYIKLIEDYLKGWEIIDDDILNI